MWADTYWTNEYWASQYWTNRGIPDTGLFLFINGVDRTDILKQPSLIVNDNLENRKRLNFVLIIKGPPTYFRPLVGEVVFLFLDGTLIYGGTIETISEVEPVINVAIFLTIQCTDFTHVLDRYLVIKIYDNLTSGAIIKDAVQVFANQNGENIDTANVSDGLTIERSVYGYRKLSDVIRELTNINGFSMFVDEFKRLFFFDRATFTAPFGLSVGSKNYRKLTVKRSRSRYRNKQYIRAGNDLSDPQTEDFAGDTERTTFVTALEIAETPTITLNTGAQTVGERGVDNDADFDWFVRKGEKEVTQSGSGTVLIGTDVLQVIYQGFIPITVIEESASEISLRASIEGGGGIYENVQDDDSIEKRGYAIQKAQGLVARFTPVPTILEFETDDKGLKAGQLLSVNLPTRGDDVVGDFLIDSIRSKVLIKTGQAADSPVILRSTVTALSGKHLGSWFEFFRKLQESGRQLKFREGEKLLNVRTFPETIDIVEAFNTVDPLGDVDDDPFTGFQWGTATDIRAFWGRKGDGVFTETTGSQWQNPPEDS